MAIGQLIFPRKESLTPKIRFPKFASQATASVQFSKNGGAKQIAERQWTYFHHNLNLSDNSTSAQVDDVEVSLNLPPATGTSISGKVCLPKSGSLGVNPYNAVGLLLKDGLWNYTWDVDLNGVSPQITNRRLQEKRVS